MLLILHEDEHLIETLSRELEREECRLITTKDPEDALRLLALNDVQVVLVQQDMKQVSGTDFLRRVKAIHPGIVRMVLGDQSEISGILEAISEGSVNRFISKPWQANQIREHIRQALRESDLLRENQRLRAQVEALQRKT